MQNPLIESGEYGVNDTFRNGQISIKECLEPAHPLELRERNYVEKSFEDRLKVARTIQGLHAPLKIAAELRACRTIGRLPCLPSSNLMIDTLKGNDDTITFDDVFNDPEKSEVIRPAFLVMAKANWTGF